MTITVIDVSNCYGHNLPNLHLLSFLVFRDNKDMNGILLRQAKRSAAPAHSMLNVQDNLGFCLDHGKVLTLEGDNRGRTILCRQGMMWITQPGDPSDYRLTATEAFTVSRHGRIVVQALEDSIVEVDSNTRGR